MEKNKSTERPDSLKEWLVRFLKGTLIGIGGILPGLSGGVLAVIFGVYDRMIAFLADIKKDTMRQIRYFIPIGIGFVVGIIVFSFFVKEAFGRYEAIFTSLFIGFVMGTFPSLYRTAGKEGRSSSDLVLMVLTALGLFALMFIGGQKAAQLPSNFWVWLMAGAMVGLGVIVPGLSPSNFLIYLGLYEPMSAGISRLDLSVIVPLAIGALACVMFFAKVVSLIFSRHYSKMYHFILGTVLGSSMAIFPTVVFPSFSSQSLAESGLTFGMNLFLNILMFVIGTAFSYWFSTVEARVSQEDIEELEELD